MEVSPLRHFVKKETSARKRRWTWKLKIGFSWKAMKKAALGTFKPHRRHLSCAPTMKHLPKLCAHQEMVIEPNNNKQQPPKKKKGLAHPSLGNLLLMPYTAADFVDNGNHMTPTKSPKENISDKWRQLHGSGNWSGTLDPLHPLLRREVVKYGEFVEATYDAFDFDPLSEYCGSCRYNRHKIFEELGLTGHGYKVTKYIYGMSHVDLPRWFERSLLGSTWSKDSNWMGYVAVSNDQESMRIGRRDIVVAWRGTVTPTEWLKDLTRKLDRFGNRDVRVQHGFKSIYKSKSDKTRYNKLSASEQVMDELERLVNFFKEREEEISLTITGHSLGGALSLLCAYEAATSFPNLFINVITFGAPRVGNIFFREELRKLGVKTLRVEIKQDIVPKLPGLFFNQLTQKLNVITTKLHWIYRHVGTQLKLDMHISPYLKGDSDYAGCHNMELYLHLLDGYISKTSKFRWSSRRDIALVNKSSDLLKDELKIPHFWYQMPHKGLVLNKHGRWVKPSRETEDVPTPLGTQVSHHIAFE